MTVRPASVNFRMYPGATFSEVTTLRDSAGDEIDLTGFTALMHIRREIDDVLPLFTLSTTDGSIVLGDAAGTITLNLTNVQTAAPTVEWEGEVWVHDLLLTNTNTTPDTVERTYQGSVIVQPGVTRPTP